MSISSPTAILHIGVEKTGTTSIQRFLRQNARTLSEARVLYPLSPGRYNHVKLAAYAADDSKRDDLRIREGIRSHQDLMRFRAEFERALAAELRRQPHETVIFSGEHCHSRLTSEEEIARLKRLLDRVTSQARVVVYLRRQDELAVSAFSTAIRYGEVLPPLNEYLDEISEKDYYFNYSRIYRNWAQVFGADNIRVRVFEEGRFVERDLLRDFIATVGVPWVQEFTSPGRLNLGLSFEALEFLRNFNRHVPQELDGEINRDRAGLIEILEDAYRGSKYLPSRNQALSLYRRFEGSNRLLKNQLAPNTPGSLFAEDFSFYPNEASQNSLTMEEAVQVAAVLWMGAADRYRAQVGSSRRWVWRSLTETPKLLSILRRIRASAAGT